MPRLFARKRPNGLLVLNVRSRMYLLQNGDFALAGFWCLVIFVISFVCLVALNLFGEKKSKGKKHAFHRKNKKTTGSL